MTEVASAATVAAGNVTKPGSVGIPMLNTVVSIFEPGTETELPIGERGEICICTPTAMKGYYNKPEETAYLLRRHADGQLWAHTGDIGSMDEDGFCVSGCPHQAHHHPARRLQGVPLHDRKRHQPPPRRAPVLRGGLRRYRPHPGTAALCFVVLEPAATGKKRQILRELRQLCLEELPEYVQPVGYKFISEMPFTPVGKVDYRKLEEEITPRDY